MFVPHLQFGHGQLHAAARFFKSFRRQHFALPVWQCPLTNGFSEEEHGRARDGGLEFGGTARQTAQNVHANESRFPLHNSQGCRLGAPSCRGGGGRRMCRHVRLASSHGEPRPGGPGLCLTLSLHHL
ncbi:hypothetical protein BS78_04G058900 [Paspalum vaginatum]|nr:hypothetical protein BS78_04G058900 [Paspalum vaginatum]